MNNVLLIGTLARLPEFRVTNSGMSVFEGTIAGEETIIGHDGKARTLPFYERIEILGKPADWANEKNYQAGDPVLVEGSLDYSSWDAPEGGKRSAIRTKVLRLEALAAACQTVQDASGGLRMIGGTNEVRIVANLTREPDLRYTPAGDAVLSLSLAVNEQWTDRQNVKQEKVHWVDAVAWRDLAEASKNLKKGDPVMIFGRLTHESWTDKEGNKRSSTKVEASKIEALARSQGSGAAEGTTRTAPARPTTQPVAAGSRPSYGKAGVAPAGQVGDSGLQDFPPEEALPF